LNEVVEFDLLRSCIKEPLSWEPSMEGLDFLDMAGIEISVP
jgi:hypothetical protein